jgi:alpha-ribazole phosphatase
MKLWLLRHAAVVLEPGLCYGASDVAAHTDLTQQAADAVAPLLPAGASIRVSGLRRAQQLVHELQRLRPELGPLQVDVRLNEMNFGTWEMTPWDAVPRPDFDTWMADFGEHRFGGAESVQMLLARVAAALHATRAAGGKEAIWVCHAGVIRAALYLVAHGDLPLTSAAQWPKDAPATGGWTSVTL